MVPVEKTAHGLDYSSIKSILELPLQNQEVKNSATIVTISVDCNVSTRPQLQAIDRCARLSAELFLQDRMRQIGSRGQQQENSRRSVRARNH